MYLIFRLLLRIVGRQDMVNTKNPRKIAVNLLFVFFLLVSTNHLAFAATDECGDALAEAAEFPSFSPTLSLIPEQGIERVRSEVITICEHLQESAISFGVAVKLYELAFFRQAYCDGRNTSRAFNQWVPKFSNEYLKQEIRRAYQAFCSRVYNSSLMRDPEAVSHSDWIKSEELCSIVLSLENERDLFSRNLPEEQAEAYFGEFRQLCLFLREGRISYFDAQYRLRQTIDSMMAADPGVWSVLREIFVETIKAEVSFISTLFKIVVGLAGLTATIIGIFVGVRRLMSRES